MQKGGHIIDPRTARAIGDKRAAWSSAPDAATADALSTAFMIMGLDEIKKYCSLHSNTLAIVIFETQDESTPEETILRFGAWERLID